MSRKLKDLSRVVGDLEILGAEIKVEFVHELKVDDVDCLGVYYPGRDDIQILDVENIPYGSQLSTLLHECIECIVSKLELDIEHRDVTALENAIFQLFRKNPDLARAFQLYRTRGE